MKWVVGSIITVMLLIIAVASSVLHVTPVSTPALMRAYERIVPQEENGPWIDVYLFDFFYWHNQFERVTGQTIALHARWFDVPGRSALVEKLIEVKAGKRDIVIKRIPAVAPTHLTLVQALVKYGLEGKVQEAIALEGQLSGTYQVVFAPVAQSYLRYQPIRVEALFAFLRAGGSAFTWGDIETIVQAARAAGINPLLLMAITGQEESFVPRSWPAAQQIVNNPFNVNVSWRKYNTNLADAAQIAANSIRLKLSTPAPSGEDAIAWINDPRNPDGLYATDPHWADGVRAIFWALQDVFATRDK